MEDEVFKIGNCGEIWAVRNCEDSVDIVDHKPVTNKNENLNVGICENAPLMILTYSNNINDWESLLGVKLNDGAIALGEITKVIHLNQGDWRYLRESQTIGLSEIKVLAEKELRDYTKIEKIG